MVAVAKRDTKSAPASAKGSDKTLQINGKPTPSEIGEAARMMRSGLSWTRLLARQAYALFAAAVIIWELARAFSSGNPVNWHNVDLLLVFLAIILAFMWVRTMRILGTTKAAKNHSFPDTLSLETSGINAQSSNGASTSVPWTAFKGWRIGSRIILLDYAEGKRSTILPMGSLPATQQETLSGTVQSYLGPPTNRR